MCHLLTAIYNIEIPYVHPLSSHLNILFEAIETRHIPVFKAVEKAGLNDLPRILDYQ